MVCNGWHKKMVGLCCYTIAHLTSQVVPRCKKKNPWWSVHAFFIINLRMAMSMDGKGFNNLLWVRAQCWSTEQWTRFSERYTSSSSIIHRRFEKALPLHCRHKKLQFLVANCQKLYMIKWDRQQNCFFFSYLYNEQIISHLPTKRI